MRRHSSAFVLLVLLAVPPPVAQAGPPSEYAALLATLKAGKTDIDYGRLRLSYMDSPEYKQAKDTSDAAKAMVTDAVTASVMDAVTASASDAAMG